MSSDSSSSKLSPNKEHIGMTSLKNDHVPISPRIRDVIRRISRRAILGDESKSIREKIHEELMSENESLNSLEFKDMFLIMSNKEMINFYKKYGKFKVIKNCFSYNSGNNKNFLNKNEIKSLINEHFIL